MLMSPLTVAARHAAAATTRGVVVAPRALTTSGAVAAAALNVHASAAAGFTRATVAPYEQGRPEWEPAQIELALRESGLLAGARAAAAGPDGRFPARPFVEIGAGTGKSTRPLYSVLQARCAPGAHPRLVCVEPSDLSAELAAALPGATFVRAVAEDMAALPTGSVSGVACFQAFHWFANAAAVAEIHRLLAPGAPLVLAWNTRDAGAGPAMAALEAAIDAVYDAEPVPTPRQHTGEWRRAFDGGASARLFGPLHHLPLPRAGGGHAGSEDDIVAWALSISVVAKLPPDAQAGVAERVRAAVRLPSMPRLAPAPDGTPRYLVPMRSDCWWTTKLLQ
jgi:SAM-dependent methyltransferase